MLLRSRWPGMWSWWKSVRITHLIRPHLSECTATATASANWVASPQLRPITAHSVQMRRVTIIWTLVNSRVCATRPLQVDSEDGMRSARLIVHRCRTCRPALRTLNQVVHDLRRRLHSHFRQSHQLYQTIGTGKDNKNSKYCRIIEKKLVEWIKFETRSIWKMLGPFTTASRLTPTHQMSLAVLSRTACASMFTTTPPTTTTRDRGDRYGPMEWARDRGDHYGPMEWAQ